MFITKRSHNFNCSVYFAGTDLRGSAAYIICWVWWYHCRDHNGSIRKNNGQKTKKEDVWRPEEKD